MAGLLHGLKTTTHHEAYSEFVQFFPGTTLIEGVKWVDNGRIIPSAGITAGINTSLHAVAKLLGEVINRDTTMQMEYDFVF